MIKWPLIPQDHQGGLKIDDVRHLGAGLIKKNNKYERVLDVKKIKEMQKRKRKKYFQAWQLIPNWKCHNAVWGLYGLIEYCSSVCARVQLQYQKINPVCSQRDPQWGWGHTNWSHCTVCLLFWKSRNDGKILHQEMLKKHSKNIFLQIFKIIYIIYIDIFVLLVVAYETTIHFMLYRKKIL